MGPKQTFGRPDVSMRAAVGLFDAEQDTLSGRPRAAKVCAPDVPPGTTRFAKLSHNERHQVHVRPSFQRALYEEEQRRRGDAVR